MKQNKLPINITFSFGNKKSYTLFIPPGTKIDRLGLSLGTYIHLAEHRAERNSK